MGKRPKLYQGRDGYEYVEIQPSSEEDSSLGFDIREGGLTVWAVGNNIVRNVPVSAKKARQFARALLKLADQVDPPALKTKYFRLSIGLYRVVAGGRPEGWDPGEKEWFKSHIYYTAEDLKGPDVTPVPRKDVPKDAR